MQGLLRTTQTSADIRRRSAPRAPPHCIEMPSEDERREASYLIRELLTLNVVTLNRAVLLENRSDFRSIPHGNNLHRLRIDIFPGHPLDICGRHRHEFGRVSIPVVFGQTVYL